MSARVYFLKRVKDCNDMSIMSAQDEQWRRTSLLCLYTVIFLFYNRMQSKHKQTKCELLQITAFSVGITILNQRRIIWKDDIEFVTEFPCLLGHPVYFQSEHFIANKHL